MSANTVSFGVIGAGRIGKIHAENLAARIPGACVEMIADLDLEAARTTAARLHIPKVSADCRDILANPAIEAVAICSSTNTHAGLIIDAARAGKHIFCEKPIDHDLARIDAALKAVEEAGVKLQIGFNRRFDPNFKYVHDLIAAGKIGQPHILRITSRDPAPPPPEYVKVSGGMFLDMTIHDFDMARYLMGSEVTEVYAAAGVLVDPLIGEAGDVDTAVITLKFANGAMGVIDNSRKAIYGYDQRVEAFGSAGMAAAANETPHRSLFADEGGIHTAKPLYFFLERYMESFIAELRGFVEAILNDTPPLVGGADGRAPVLIGLAAQRSYRENRPVRLAELLE